MCEGIEFLECRDLFQIVWNWIGLIFWVEKIKENTEGSILCITNLRKGCVEIIFDSWGLIFWILEENIDIWIIIIIKVGRIEVIVRWTQ